MKRIATAFSLALLASSTACVSSTDAPLWFRSRGWGAMPRAATELECPRESLRVVDLGDWTLLVTGCGRKAVYGVDRIQGAWRLESAARRCLDDDCSADHQLAAAPPETPIVR